MSTTTTAGRIKDSDRIALIVRGGSGKNLMATALVSSLKAVYPDKPVTVVTGFSEVFLHNPKVDRVVDINDPVNFFDDHFVADDTFVVAGDPYTDPDYVQGRVHLLTAWCRMFGISPPLRKRPELYLTRDELAAGERLVADANRPVLLMQVFGGKEPERKTPESLRESQLKMYRRDLPTPQARVLAKRLSEQYSVYLIKAPKQPDLPYARSISAPLRHCYAAIHFAQAFLLTDSFMQHAVAARGKKAVVVWGGTSPTKVGYSLHLNVVRTACPTPACHRPNTHLHDESRKFGLWTCPFNEACLDHDTDSLIAGVGKASYRCMTSRMLDVFGIKRSGNHPFITWVLANSKGAWSVHYNNVPSHCRLDWRDGNRRALVDRDKPLDVQFPPASREDMKQCGQWESLIVSREDADLRHGFATTGLLKYGRVLKHFTVLLLRDPFNHLASIFRRYVVDGEGGKNDELSWEGYVQRWQQYAREFVGQTNFLGGKLCLNYNLWLTSRDYRQEVAKALGLASSDKGLLEVSQWGSSFDSNDPAKGPEQYLTRWKRFDHEGGYRGAFAWPNGAVVELAEQIFTGMDEAIKWAKTLSEAKRPVD